MGGEWTETLIENVHLIGAFDNRNTNKAFL